MGWFKIERYISNMKALKIVFQRVGEIDLIKNLAKIESVRTARLEILARSNRINGQRLLASK